MQGKAETVTMILDTMQLEMILSSLRIATKSMDGATFWAKACEYRRLEETIRLALENEKTA